MGIVVGFACQLHQVLVDGLAAVVAAVAVAAVIVAAVRTVRTGEDGWGEGGCEGENGVEGELHCRNGL